jgi:hypothetical protein
VTTPPTPTRLTGAARTLPEWEQILILDAAGRFDVDAAALAALRLAENGGPGREYGVLSVPAPTYQEQLDVAARSFKNSEARYREATGLPARDDAGRYTDGFLRFFSARWAPLGADNDPRGLDEYHAGNLVAYYAGSGLA